VCVQENDLVGLGKVWNHVKRATIKKYTTKRAKGEKSLQLSQGS